MKVCPNCNKPTTADKKFCPECGTQLPGVVYHVDTEHCFDGDSDCLSIGFDKSEPRGGFNYVKPEPKKKTSFLDLLK